MSALPLEPPSIWTAAHEVSDRSDRSQQKELGASDTVCQRRAAYILAGTEPTDHHEKRAALLGTYAHDGLLTSARTEYGWQVERSVRDEGILGHVDAVQLDEATAARLPRPMRPKIPAPGPGVIVEDVKTKSVYLWDKVLRYGPTEAELRQAYLYAGALASVGFEDVPGQRYLARLGPLEIASIRFRFICRDNGDEHIHEIPYDPVRATHARWWVQGVRELATPERARRDFDGPGLDAVCDHCQYVTECWGVPAPGRTHQSALVHTDADRAQALEEYVAAHELEAAGKKAKKFARAKLDGAPAGIYGANELGWSGGNPTTEPDVEAMVDLYETEGLTVPMTPDDKRMIAVLKKAGLAVPQRASGKTTAVSINVKPVRS
ncbi:hypothetical protein ACFC0K_15945 [Streptomyces hydrogenans]|uniref:hypothetical protein n=1 Tax=Streptomyces hydrogenans TaxID=1873719 RepID=UPI0035D6D1C9